MMQIQLKQLYRDTAEAAIQKVKQLGNAKHYWQKVLHAINQLALPRTRRLERELSAVVDENQSLTVELERVRNEFERTRIRDRNEIAEFGQRISDLETERDTANQQLHVLKTLLEEASIRQESTATQIRRLESKLEEEYAKNESILETMQATLTQVQHKQQNLLRFQSDLDDLVSKTKLQLLEVIQTESVKPHNHILGMVLIAALFLLGAFAGATSIWIVRQDLLELSAVTKDLNISIKEHISKHEVALTEPPIQKDFRISPGLGDTTNVAPVDYIRNLDKPGQDYTNTRLGEAGQAGATHTLPVSFNKTELDPVEQESSVPHQTKINGYTHQPEYGSAEWDPPLLLSSTEEQGYDGTSVFNPFVKELQTNLLVLGFDLGQGGADGFIGAHTEKALQEFQLLYLPVLGPQQKTDPNHLAAIVRRFADLAQEDERQFKINSGVLAAIRLSSLRTGVEFSFLMELAAAESTFDSDSRAAKSSAAGLYQFKHDTWLDTVKRHGDKYGIESYVSQVEFFVGSDGNRRPMISDSVVYQHVLDLRHNPRMAALMAAEYLKDNMQRLSLSLSLGQELGRTEMYLTYFLGVSGAITFLELLDKNPDEVAGDVFPGPAARNMNIFHPRNRKPRTVAEVYDVFNRKFNNSRYRDWRAN